MNNQIKLDRFGLILCTWVLILLCIAIWAVIFSHD